ncbi:conserved Plasmodium protein, unknown function [Plasmodium sp. gorilla clade G2]|uniref:conserved Plasmodium protein, unknown function n=1 Tax=Plasmodium sp. gorilla clade G2 TaxID=880535 RepID=UPI000D205245|nr:conserved Plasmodium protein, unknown function [Plasmodium sp. gorilla clade G2]SOV11001.1 conserved Plasmodium protein, unknown function [Plasmodium sp. gorilla clade G2]
MNIEERKKEIQTGIYEQEIFEELGEVLKEKFFKYINEENYEYYIYEEKEDKNLINYNKYDKEFVCKDRKKNNTCITYDHIYSFISFKKFTGKSISFDYNGNYKYHNFDLNEEIDNNIKEKIIKNTYSKNIFYDNIKGQIILRIENIKRIISIIKNYTYCIHKLQNEQQQKKNDSTSLNNYPIDFNKLLVKLYNMENYIYEIIKYEQLYDPYWNKNQKYYKYVNNFIYITSPLKNKNRIMKNNKNFNNYKTIYDVLLKYNMDNVTQDDNISSTLRINKLTNIHFLNLLYFKYQNVTTKYLFIHNKLYKYEDLLKSPVCFNDKENISSIFLSFFLFLNICLNENTYKRILNYIYLIKLKLKKKIQYIKHKDDKKLLNMLSNIKDLIMNININNKSHNKLSLYLSSIFNILTLQINDNHKQTLQLYKKLLNCEIKINILSDEVQNINKLTETLNKKLDANIQKWKNIKNKIISS